MYESKQRLVESVIMCPAVTTGRDSVSQRLARSRRLERSDCKLGDVRIRWCASASISGTEQYGHLAPVSRSFEFLFFSEV